MIRAISIIATLVLAACSVGGGSNNSADTNNNTTTKKSKRSDLRYADESKENPDTGEFIRTLTFSFDFGNSEGLTSFSKDLAISTSNSGYVTVTDLLEKNCTSGTAQPVYRLIKIVKANDELKEIEIPEFAMKEMIGLERFSKYVLRTNVDVSGNCTDVKLVVTARMKITTY